jgi:hypothetical protein
MQVGSAKVAKKGLFDQKGESNAVPSQTKRSTKTWNGSMITAREQDGEKAIEYA